MNRGRLLLSILVVAAVAVIPADLLYTSRFVPRFKEIERQRIIVSNQMATAKIVSENLNHVRELVYQNMDFAGHKDSVPQEKMIFDFITSSVNDLKMNLVSIRPYRPVTSGRVTTTGYDLELMGDFFSFGELCSKLENSRRVMAITSFSLEQNGQSGVNAYRTGATGRNGKRDIDIPTSTRRTVLIRLHLETYRVKKG